MATPKQIEAPAAEQTEIQKLKEKLEANEKEAKDLKLAIKLASMTPAEREIAARQEKIQQLEEAVLLEKMTPTERELFNARKAQQKSKAELAGENFYYNNKTLCWSIAAGIVLFIAGVWYFKPRDKKDENNSTEKAPEYRMALRFAPAGSSLNIG
jgi:multidrug resistance efflux pump